MFETLLVQPIFNILTLIYAVIPGHDFGISIILFTIVVRILMWPLVKKQLHHAKAMKALQPELKKIKKAAKGNRQQESMMVMALYKEKEINPFASIGILFVQLPILIALYSGISRIVKDPQTIIDFSYSWVKDLSWMQQLSADISLFKNELLGGLVDLNRAAITDSVYWPALIIVLLSVIVQYYQSKQLLPSDSESKSVRKLMSEATAAGKQPDQSEISAAMGRNMRYLLPLFIFLISIGIASALALYWLVGGAIAWIQQSIVLGKDKDELLSTTASITTENDETKEVAAEVIQKKKPSKKTTAKKTKRRK